MANPSVRGYQAQNLQKLMNGLKVYVKDTIKPMLKNVLTQKAQQIVSYIDNGANIPEYLSHLHDATGVGVYVDGMISSFIPTKRATKLGKSGVDGVNHYQIDGNSFLQQAIAEASSRFNSGIWFVIFSAVPYAYHINAFGSPIGRGQNFFKNVVDTSVSEILSGLRPIANVNAQNAQL